MGTKTAMGSQNDKKLIVVGLSTIGILFLIYSRFENPGLTPDAINSIERKPVDMGGLWSRNGLRASCQATLWKHIITTKHQGI